MSTAHTCTCGHLNPPRPRGLSADLHALLERRPELLDLVHVRVSAAVTAVKAVA